MTTIYVTHDQVEAMTMGTRIAVMRKGLLQQLGPPQELYDRPANLFVATFIGSPAMNLLTARLESDAGSLGLRVDDTLLRLPAAVTSGRPRLAGLVGTDVALGIRPESLRLEEHAPDDPRLQGVVALVESLGPERLVHVEIKARPVLTDDVIEIARDTDAAVAWTLQHEAVVETVTLVVRTGPTARFGPGDRVEVSLQAEAIQLFELATGEAIRD